MSRFLLSALFVCTLLSSAWADDQTVAWPLPASTVPPGGNPATIPAPRLEWFEHFQTNLDQSKKRTAIDLIFDGDSITDAWQGTGRDVWKQNYGNWNSENGPSKYNVFDFGIGGDKTENVLWRLQHGQVDNLHPKLIVLLIGTNDFALEPPQIAEGVKAVIDEYRKRCPDAVILLQGIFPRGPTADDNFRKKMKATDDILSGFGDGKNVIYTYFGDKFLTSDGTLTKEMMPDFLHPSAKGYTIWADAIRPYIEKYVPAPAPAK